MNAAIVTIGNELLAGYTVDSNATWMGRKLMDLGIETVFKISVRDVKKEVTDALALAGEKGDVILTTGGLGPTLDDVTKEAFCQFSGASLVFHEEYYETLRRKFRSRGMEMPESNRDQARIPDRGDIIPNPRGSALGIAYERGGKRFYLLPGVPLEMKTMMEETVLPRLKKLVSSPKMVTTLRTTGMPESAVMDRVSDLVTASDVRVAFIPGFTGVDIRLTSSRREAVGELASALRDRLGSAVYGEGWVKLEETVGTLLRNRGLTVSAAESCTGGLLGDRLTDVPGSSDYFLGGVVCYANESKVSTVGVTESTLATAGAVSEEAAREMASGVRRVFQADIGISITGIAGPTGATAGKPVGLTFIGLDFAGDSQVNRYVFTDDRRFNKELAAQTALNILRLSLM
ncbi:MAG: competence/damage-inducible protein A [Fidelibacterota bacterium]